MIDPEERKTAKMLAEICNDADTACPAEFLHVRCPFLGSKCKDVGVEDWLDNKGAVEEEDDGGPAPRPVKEEVPAHPWKAEAKPVKTAAEIKAFEEGFDLCLRMFDCFAKMEKARRNLFQSDILRDKVEAAERDRARSVTLFRYGEYEVALDAATYKGEPK